MANLKLMKKIDSLYGGRDPRDIPAYPIREAVRYIRVPYGNLYRWCFGTSSDSGQRKPGIIKPASTNPPMLSFWNLAEVYILSGLQRHHGITLQNARRAVHYVEEHFGQKRPLLTQQFQTNGIDLFVEKLEEEHLINASKGGQLTIKGLIQNTLKRVERDYDGLIKSIYPYFNDSAEDRTVEIDPMRAFGRPIVVGTRVPTETLAMRYRAGETKQQLSEDYVISPDLIEMALRWESNKNEAA